MSNKEEKMPGLRGADEFVKLAESLSIIYMPHYNFQYYVREAISPEAELRYGRRKVSYDIWRRCSAK